MTLSIFNKTLLQGPKSRFLMEKPGFKLLPLQFNYQGNLFSSDLGHNSSSLKIHFSIYFNFEQYLSFHFNIDYTKRYIDYDNVIDGQPIGRLQLASEVFYEYGNEEEHLPPLETYQIFYTEKEMLELIINQINQFEKIDNFKLFSNISDKFYKLYSSIKEKANNSLINNEDILSQNEEDVFYMKQLLNNFIINESLEVELNK